MSESLSPLRDRRGSETLRVFDNPDETETVLQFFPKREAFPSRDSHGADL
jgi:hypothetical protein